ncbi:MAG: TolC family outer membrane protein [Alphaproteobacteria bacterium]|nr:TolC family outer membrane protein [Alphaproteobacteria bacterium]
MKRFGFYFSCAFALGVMPARADMYASLQRVYDANPVIAQQRQAVDAARADVRLARTDAKPYLGVGANIGAARTELAGQTFDYVPTQIGIQAQQNLFKGFATIAQIKAAKGILESQKALLYATQQDVFMQAINAYIDVLNSEQVLNLNKNNQRVLQEYYDYCVQRAQVGMLTKTDVAQASARLESAKYHVFDARAAYDNSLETFRRIYGDVDSEYVDISLKRVAHVFPENVDIASTWALKNHPALLALEAQSDAARENITIARQSMLPSIDVRASVMQLDDLPYVDRVRDGRVGVYLSVPLYDKGKASANVEKVRFTVAGIDDQIANTRAVILENLHQAWNLYDAQVYAISAAQAAVEANKLALRGIRAEQKSGRRTVLDVLNAEQELLNSQVALTRAQHGKTAAYFAILASSGLLSPQNLGIKTGAE